MKKKIFCSVLFSVLIVSAFAQNNLSVDVDSEIYRILENCQSRGLCDILPGAKPYTQNRILQAVNEILENEDRLSATEKAVLNDYLEEHSQKEEKVVSKTHLRLQNNILNVPFSFEYMFGLEVSGSSGLYTDSDFNKAGFDFIPSVDFRGDLSRYISYTLKVLIDVTRMPLYECGTDYFVGYSWFNTFPAKEGTENTKPYEVGDYADALADNDNDKSVADAKYGEPDRRTIRTLKNTAYLPFAYKKKWSGQMYLLENMSASGLEGWPQTLGVSGTINAEIRTSLLNNSISIGAGRINHEWAAMDTGSSLVLNRSAQPFFSADMTVELFPFLTYSALTGILEYPNPDYMAESSWPDGIEDDSLFQNAFSLNMIELDYKYFHFDFGSSVVWPKRFEIGYIFPLVNFVEYQNHIGDNDNCALFGDIMFRKPGLGSIWASLYLDEINGLNNNPLTSSRAMFAGQLGTKIIIPKLPFASVSMRYTKVEPFCYTHHSINYTPWYSHYVCESYTNNGECLGYYLPPNADEFFFRFETTPVRGLSTSFQYQFIRHGADYGTQQVQGSSLYSELSNANRDDIEKHFLHDGAYNWMHIISAGASYSTKKTKVPFNIYGSLGFLYSYYTMIDDEDYEMTILGNHKADGNTKYHFVDNDEYPVQCGIVMTFGIKLWNF